jgi:D-beta-D-heptose 7-phosphate kinase/D-beta-D-heptose 1-phosphate adenosyltransferase
VSIAIPDFTRARVVVAGDIMLDRYLFGATSRISPEAPVPVVHVRESNDRPGGAANVAVNLAALGVETTLLGFVGKDEDAVTLQSLLEQKNIRCRFSESADWPTITKTRVLSRSQQLIRLDREEPCGDSGATLATILESVLSAADVVVLSDYGKGALNDVARLVEACRQAKVPVFIDPKGTDFKKYRGASLITPNQGEFEAVAGPCKSDNKLVAEGEKMLRDLSLDALLITRSEKGMLLIQNGADPVFLSTQAREVYDVTGAGDTVIATIAAAIASKESLQSAAILANLAAGIVVRKIGVASVSPAELDAAARPQNLSDSGVVTELELLALVDAARSRGERIVMTNGCFDILHPGHVAYLKEAASLGDRLIVAVNDNDSVSRLKGDSRPINDLPDRMAVLSGLASVDWVVPFTEDTPKRLIQSVMPDILAKGGDYQPEDVAGGRDVLANGGQVRILAFRDGHSSSRIIVKLGKSS